MNLTKFKQNPKINEIYNSLIYDIGNFSTSRKESKLIVDNYFKEIEKRYGEKRLIEIKKHIYEIKNTKTEFLKEFFRLQVLYFEKNKKIKPIISNLIKIKNNIPINLIYDSKHMSMACTETYIGFYRASLEGTLTTIKIKMKNGNKVEFLRLIGKTNLGQNGRFFSIGINELLLNPFSKDLDVYSYKTVNGKITNLKKEYDLNQYRKGLRFEGVKKPSRIKKIKNAKKLIIDLLTEIDKFYTKDGVSGIERMSKLKKAWDIKTTETNKIKEIKKQKTKERFIKIRRNKLR